MNGPGLPRPTTVQPAAWFCVNVAVKPAMALPCTTTVSSVSVLGSQVSTVPAWRCQLNCDHGTWPGDVGCWGPPCSQLHFKVFNRPSTFFALGLMVLFVQRLSRSRSQMARTVSGGVNQVLPFCPRLRP